MAEMQAEPNLIRLRVNMRTETSEAIQEMMGSDKQTSASEVVRRAVAVYYFIWKLKKTGKKHIFIGRRPGKIMKELVLEL